MKRNPTAIDLFSGAGGLSKGLQLAGYKVIGAVEIDALACSKYKLNHSNVRLWEADITKLTGTKILKELKLRPGELDLLAACPPCQGFSSMRTKNGARKVRDRRNDLIFEVLRIVRTLKPKSIMLENVPGLARNWRYVAFQKRLVSLGYQITFDVLNTLDYGVPQRRRRLVLLASQLGEPQFAPKDSSLKTVRQFIGKLTPPIRSRDPLHNYSSSRSRRIKELFKKIPSNGGSRSALPRRQQLVCHKRIEGFRDVYGRMAWDKPAPTITGGCINPSKGRFLHPVANRAITLREAALLQSFPKSYRFDMDKGRFAVALLIGNALPPEFIRRHALALKELASV